jgi:hypothetical protein
VERISGLGLKLRDLYGKSQKPLLRKVDLRSSYTVYEEDGAYTVTSESPRDQRYECRVVPEEVEYMCARTSGQRIPSSQTDSILEPSL